MIRRLMNRGLILPLFAFYLFDLSILLEFMIRGVSLCDTASTRYVCLIKSIIKDIINENAISYH